MKSQSLLLDFLVIPFVLILVYAIAFRYRNKYYGVGHPYRKYFIKGLTFKIIGAIFISCIYMYYYKGGDTLYYFYQAKIINTSFSESPVKWINLILRIPETNAVGYYKYTRLIEFYIDPASYFVCSFAAFIGLFLFNTYIPTAIVFAAISYTGLWALFRTFSSVYPLFVKQVAISILFIPSIIIWGSGIFKDTLCICFLGWMTHAVFLIMIKRNISFKNFLVLGISVFVIYLIKLYILLAFIPALLVWILFIYTNPIKPILARLFVKSSILAIVFGLSFFSLSYLGEEYLGRYSLENITKTSELTRGWIHFSTGDEGSKYDLGEITTPGQMITKMPAAINVTLFRPYLWEARKVLVLLSALESFLFLILTIKILITIGIRKLWKTVSYDPIVQFCLMFALMFAFSVGISTYNFGALSRYKIPCLPFYAMAMMILYYKNQSPNSKLFKLFGI